MSDTRVFAGPATLGTTALLILAPIGLIAAAISDAGADGTERLAWIAAGAVAQLGLTAIVLLGRALGADRSRIGVLITVGFAVATRGALIATIVPLVGAQDPLSPFERIIGSSLTFGMWMLFIGAAIESMTRTRQRLRALLMRVDVTLTEADALQQAVVSQVDPAAMHTIEDLARTARHLHRVIDERLRPLSHRLWFGVSSPHLWQQTVLRILRQPVPVAPVCILLAVFLFWNSFLRHDAAIAVGSTVSAIGSLAVVLSIGQHWARRSSLDPAVGCPLTVLIAVAVSAGALYATGLSDGAVNADDLSGWLGVSATNLLVLVLSMIITSDSRARAESLRELTDAVDDLQPRRQAAASFLHNSVNSTWRALAMQLDLASRDGDVDQARWVLEQMRVESTRRSFEDHERTSLQRLADTPARWEGLAHITVDVDGEVPAALSSPISELVDEAITNAVRHGRARHVEAFIAVTEQFVEVVVIDDGSADPAPAGGTRGLGSAWLDTHTEWSREYGAQGTRLTVRWPCLP